MQALIVGADRVRGVRDEILRAAPRLGIEQVEHWPGRKASENHRRVSNRTGLVVFLCDRSNHMLMQTVRRQAEARGIPMVFCRHSGAQVRGLLEALAPVKPA